MTSTPPTAGRTSRGLAYDIWDLRAPWAKSGRPIVFHHGIGTNRDIWAGWLPALAGRRTCVRFDTRGYGQSPVPPPDHRFAMDELVDDLLEVMALTGAGPVHLVGESLGGTVVLATAARHPDKVASATVSNTAFKGAGIQYVKSWRDDFRRKGVKAWSRDMMERRFVAGALNEAQRSWFEAEQDKSPEHVTVGWGEMLAAADLTKELARIKAPLMILMPDRSPFVTARMGADLAEHVTQAELVMFPGVRHGLPFSHAGECAQHLATFLDRAERGETGRAHIPRT
ncbi:MAG: alpha/beta hydrolase [Hyphomicrobiaceae bacterium]